MALFLVSSGKWKVPQRHGMYLLLPISLGWQTWAQYLIYLPGASNHGLWELAATLKITGSTHLFSAQEECDLLQVCHSAHWNQNWDQPLHLLTVLDINMAASIVEGRQGASKSWQSKTLPWSLLQREPALDFSPGRLVLDFRLQQPRERASGLFFKPVSLWHFVTADPGN